MSRNGNASRLARLVLPLLLAAVVLVSDAAAQGTPAVVGSPQGPIACANPGRAIGLSRTVEIDARRGPRFGHQQYKDVDFLQDGEIVLTFDDGPLRRHTQPVLDALAAHCTRATFFMVGRMALADPAMVREIVQRGHTVGTHTWSHRNLRSAGPTRAAAELELGVSAVRRAAGVPIAPFFRFPYLADSQAMLGYASSRNLGVFSIDADAYDYRTQLPSDVHRNIVSQLMSKRKGIVLFHDIQPSTAGALKGLLDELHKRGFKVVHMVAKAPSETVAEYDAYAEREMAKKQLAAVAQPLATRSVVWPIAPAPDGPAQAAAVVRTKSSAPAGAPGSAPPLPWGGGGQKITEPVQAAVPRPEPQPRPVRTPAEASWQGRIFQND